MYFHVKYNMYVCVDSFAIERDREEFNYADYEGEWEEQKKE